jgi:ABC-2 type transport system permease protein
MKPALISEWRKLVTIRSTFVLAGIILLATALISFFVFGYKAQIFQLMDPGFLKKGALTTINFVALFSALVGILLVTHEYRYNTIMHTLTATRNRLYVLLAKIAVVTAFAVIITLLVIVVTVGFAVLGANMQGANLAPQDLALGELLGRGVFYTWAYSMLGLLLAMIIRSQVAAIVTILVMPTVVEGLLMLLLKDNVKYLPFQALGSVINASNSGPTTLSVSAAIICVSIYLAIGFAASAVLLQRRDAN